MEKNEFKETLKKLKESSKTRKFKQSVDLIINLKNLNMKKPDHQVDQFIRLPHQKGKATKICLLCGPEMESQRENVDGLILFSQFEHHDKKAAKKLANKYNFFISQANLMTHVAKHFGRVFGPQGKMPNPKAGCVVPASANLAPIVEKLRTTIRITAKTQLTARCMVGKEDQNEDEVLENIMTVYNSIVQKLPQEENNVKNVLLKLTMGKPEKVGKASKRAE